ncbi:MAG TPA: dihydrolipoamide acetyltransferase family protein [Solirubrobacteraceae bacterium]|nr:dihydrolipoamide acetyltransferase family protein [Solirubrobacteraceae bacterium]
MTDVLMPRLSDSMEQGTILTWLSADGDEVVAGQELVEIETDKATMTYSAEADGVLSIVAAAGTTVDVGSPIARLRPAGARAAAGAGTEPASEKSHMVQVSGQPDGSGNGSAAVAVTATPMARRIAAAHGVDLGSLSGSGPRGRVVRADVMAAAGIVEEPPPAPAPAPVAAPAGAPAAAPLPSSGRAGSTDPDGERVQLTRSQQLVARRMAEAKATIPHFQVQTEVEMTAAVAFRAELKALAASQDTPAPSLNDLIVKTAAVCLRRHPRANGSYVDGGFELHDRVNVGVAVAAEDALVVPVIHDADTKTLGQIAAESRRLAAAVRDGTVTPPELSGATFTVSNLGMYGMTAITPVVNPPQAAILGVGAIRDVLARSDEGEIVDRKLLTLTLSCDHRILYGADASQFLAAIRAVLEAPLGLAL